MRDLILAEMKSLQYLTGLSIQKRIRKYADWSEIEKLSDKELLALYLEFRDWENRLDV